MHYPETTLATRTDVRNVYNYCTTESGPHADTLVQYILDLSQCIRKLDSMASIYLLCNIMLELGRIEGIRAERKRRNRHASH